VCCDEEGYGTGGFGLSGAESGGVVSFVLLLAKLAGLVDVTGENGNEESE